MYKEKGGRATGKTSKLLSFAEATNAIFVTAHKKEYVENLKLKYGFKKVKVITYLEFMYCQRGKTENEKYVIEDLDCFLEKFGVIGYSIFRPFSEKIIL